MFPEFGQNPLCLELDLDSYEGSWTHVAAFRGRGGWLMAARATIQSDRDLMRATLLAACDDHENPIPAWRAAHLTECEWSNLGECRELPPDLLDELLCEEEGAFFARWQRETKAELVTLHDRAEADLAALDARAVAIQHQADREIADLQRRRRLPDATPDHRAALAHLITDIEAESDAALTKAAARRAALRRSIDAAEEQLWERGDVLVEVEPLWCVCWQAVATRPSRAAPRVTCGGRRITGGAAIAAPGTVVASLIVEPPKQKQAVEFFRSADRQETREQKRQALHAAKTALDFRLSCLPLAERTGKLAAAAARADVQWQREHIAELRRDRVEPAGNVQMPSSRSSAPSMPDTTVDVPVVDHLTKARGERAWLHQRLADEIDRGRRYLSGSPKFRQNQAEQEALRVRIGVLDGVLGDSLPLPALPVAPTPPPPPAPPPLLERLAADRAALAAELAAHERRGAAPADGKRRFLLYAARRAELQSRLSRLDAQLAHARTAARTTA